MAFAPVLRKARQHAAIQEKDMSTNSRAGRSSSIDQDALFALALQRASASEPAHAAQAPCSASALLARAGRVLPWPSGAARRDQVPPT